MQEMNIKENLSQILTGTSGYDYPEWKGVFYPEDLKRRDFLAYYSTVFNALELNSTFYSMPTKERINSFYERSGGRLSFSVKASRLLTHEIAASWKEDAATFKEAVLPLLYKASLCSLLFQFPQSFRYTDENRIYLSKLIEAFQGFPLVIEFRHKEWIRQSVLEGLEKRCCSTVFCDMPSLQALPAQVPFTGSIAYIRLHGRNAAAWYSGSRAGGINAGPKDSSPNKASARYVYDYSDSELEQFIPVIISALEGGKKPVVFFNNHPNGSGAKNARRLGEMLSGLNKSSLNL